MNTPQIAESWMLGHFCQECHDEIAEGESVVVLDIDAVDGADGQSITRAKVTHAACVTEPAVR